MTSPKPHVRVVAAEIERDGRFLITQRQPHAVLPDLWEFPGGRVREGESDDEALARNLRTRLGVEIAVGGLTLHVAHEYEEYVLDLLVYRVAVVEGEPEPLAVQDLRWVFPSRLSSYDFPGADQRSVDALLSEG